jgi:KDO2-lipid IV(A) lauroyltransferase
MRLVALLPFFVLKWVSRLLYFVLYYVISYRRDVTELNLIYAFPDLKGIEISRIRKAYYKHLAELILEIIKGFYMPEASFKQRITLDPASKNYWEGLEAEQRQVIVVLGHYGNWEWALSACSIYAKLQPFAMYSPLSSKFWNQWMRKKRSRFGAGMIAPAQIKDGIAQIQRQPSMLAMVSDQAPPGKQFHEQRFLGLKTKFHTGPEKMARILNAVTVYVHLEKIGFGEYIIHLEEINRSPIASSDGTISGQYVTALEQEIIKQPEYWLWSHKRWKGQILYQ